MKTTNTPKERPILFSGPMVRAILDGRKTQTRRVVKLPNHYKSKPTHPTYPKWEGRWQNGYVKPPYGQPGDRLWVKETWQRDDSGTSFIYYKADGKQCSHWKSPLFMPRKASRITLEITAVRVERLQDISEEDAIAEGVTIQPDAEIASRFIRGEQGPAQLEYFALWESINGKGSWNENPWVWVVEFRKVQP